MEKDPRYTAIKYLLKKEDIKTFKEIFDHIPKTVVAADLGTNNSRMSRLIDDPSLFKMGELYKLAELIGYDSVKFVSFVVKDKYKK
jgi:arginine repressor